MNTSSCPKISLGALALVLSTLLGVNAFAAPTKAAHGCGGATVVPVIEMKTALPNGRGPLVAVQTGTKTVCHTCPVETVVTTNSLPNGRGTPVKTSVTKTGVEHTCTACASLAAL